ncbi:hypothetical protein [Actinomyces vulturis]|uniref:hypothetical protein n=1 Tax=Actinomyces vulturis TaxID=1857645 RepID=UPI000832AFF6|nr:hypothetical protein [Actinomyces vulturis]
MTIAPISQIVRSVIYLFSAITVALYGLGWSLQVLVLITGIAHAAGTPSLYALLPALVDEANNMRANALVRTFRHFVSGMGTPLAVTLALVTSDATVIGLSAVVMALTAIALGGVHIDNHATPEASLLSDIRSLGAVIRANRVMVTLIGY